MGTQPVLERFLVCGLGSLGQHCVAVLKEYGVTVSAIVELPPSYWEIPHLPSLLEDLVIGDCRQSSILEQAQIRQCRAILLVTGSERVNTETALAARRLNPQIRLILWSDKQRLNQLLGHNLGNFAAFEPYQLSASAFALAALGADMLGYFNLEGQFFRVVKAQIQPGDRWEREKIGNLNSQTCRILSHTTDTSEQPQQFFQWQAEAIVQAGDILVYVEVTDELTSQPQQVSKNPFWASRQYWARVIRGNGWRNLKQQWQQFWRSTYQNQSRIQRVVILYGITVVILWLSGTILYSLYYPQIKVVEAFYASAILLLGGYGDLFGSVEFASQPIPAGHIPWWLRLFSFGLTLTGQALIGVLYVLVTDSLLAARFHLVFRHRPLPHKDHVVLIGLSSVGQRVARLLHELKQPLVGISRTEIDPSLIPPIPLIFGRIVNALNKVNLVHAKTIVVIMDDDMENLEIGLLAHAANPDIPLVIQTYEHNFSDNVTQLFPYAQFLCGSALSAEVFAAAAFGENILSLFHFYHQTVLVTEYQIEAGDTLNGLTLSEVAYGYGVVPILYQKPNSVYPAPVLMPSEKAVLRVGDRLIVLAMSQSLQRIERGELVR